MKRAKIGSMDALSMVNPSAAGIDIGSTMHMAAINPNADDNPVRAFGTFTGDLHAMTRWFKECGVTSVAMESTGVQAPPYIKAAINPSSQRPARRPPGHAYAAITSEKIASFGALL